MSSKGCVGKGCPGEGDPPQFPPPVGAMVERWPQAPGEPWPAILHQEFTRE